jgi:hypothetical protein
MSMRRNAVESQDCTGKYQGEFLTLNGRKSADYMIDMEMPLFRVSRSSAVHAQ